MRARRCVRACLLSGELYQFLSPLLFFLSASLKVGESPHVPFSPWSLFGRLMRMAASREIQTSPMLAVSMAISSACWCSLR